MKLAKAVPILCCYASGTTCILAENVERNLKGAKAGKNGHYEIWAADQSNSSPDAVTYGDNGSFLWIWDSNDVNIQLDGGADANPLSCHPDETTGPCNLLDIFPDSLEKHNGEEWSVPGESEALSDHSNFGRLHAVVQDPYDRYVTANIFSPNGGYLGIIDVRTKEVRLFDLNITSKGYSSS